MRKSFPYLVATFLLLSFQSARAQMDSCNVFLQSRYLEVGINPLGAYGSSVNAPAGYHPRTIVQDMANGTCDTASRSLSTNIGFVGDPFMTNWTNYYGDYYLPGTPQEGWGIQINGVLTNFFTPSLWFNYLSSPQIAMGSNISYDAAGGKRSGTWQGIVDSVQITQVTSVDTDGFFFRVDVTMTNLSVLPKDNVYYLRTIDPDNEQVITGSYETRNLIEQQVSATSNNAVVSARGVTDTNNYMALGTNDARAKCFIIDASLDPAWGLDTIYAEATTYLYTGGNTLDVGIGLVFNVGHLATVDSAADSVARHMPSLHPANSKSISFVYAFKPGVADTIGNHGLTAINDISGKANLKVSPNPVHNTAQVSGLKADEQVAVYDFTGREVLHYEVGNNNVININTEHLATGMYLLIVKDKAGTVKNRVRMEKN